ncbi:MAG: magnesium/cobalt transporter CorA [Planctomycetes bacterium]|nr:magnesium/cobalt transporter CorA [Planctomycetota bacterium]
MSQRPKRKRSLRRRQPPGTAPGTIDVDPSWLKSKVSVIAYGPDEVVERPLTGTKELEPLLARFPVVWINVDGLGDADVLREIGAAFKLHRLALEDVVDVSKRAKVDRFPDHLYIALVMVSLSENVLVTEQLSLFLGKNFVITFQERPGDGFDRVRERIRGGKGLIRKADSGYLAYALLDATIDGYFPVLEHFGERLEALEDSLVASPDTNMLSEIHGLRRELVVMRRAVWPMREALNFLLREGSDAFSLETRPYLNDCYDHAVQLMDLVENHREMASGLMDVYLSSMSNRMNEVMKVLTIMSTIFIPLTFIAGIYGMNFDSEAGPWNMPELKSPFGYVVCLAVMVTVAVVMVFYYRRKGWIGMPRRDP